MKNIGIICEGPTDYVLLKKVVDMITGDKNFYVQLQPEENLAGQYGNGWKGVWKWCNDNSDIKDKIMHSIQPELDFLIIQMDGDVSRKEKVAHCGCTPVECQHRGTRNPIECDLTEEGRTECPITLPCGIHKEGVLGYVDHLKGLIASWLKETHDTCIVVPCDSTDAWIVAAYDGFPNVELIEDPWDNIIAKKKCYHDIRIPGKKKQVRIFEQFASDVCKNWDRVTQLCECAKNFEKSILSLM